MDENLKGPFQQVQQQNQNINNKNMEMYFNGRNIKIAKTNMNNLVYLFKLSKNSQTINKNRQQKMNFKLLISIYIIINSSFVFAQQKDCQVTATITLHDCFSYCARKYLGEKNFYNFNKKICEKEVNCSQGTYQQYQENVCVDSKTYHILKAFNMTILTQQKEKIRFWLQQIVHGQQIGTQIKCNQGWKSSSKIQKISSIAFIIYFCDIELKDGQIYPKTHGQYFFEKLSIEKQIQAINIAFGQDIILKILSPFKIIHLIICIIFISFSIFECFYNAGKKIRKKCSCCFKDIQDKNYEFTDKEKQQLQNYLKKKNQKLNSNNNNGFSYQKFFTEIKKKKQLIKKYQKQKSTIHKNLKRHLNLPKEKNCEPKNNQKWLKQSQNKKNKKNDNSILKKQIVNSGKQIQNSGIYSKKIIFRSQNSFQKKQKIKNNIRKDKKNQNSLNNKSTD